MLKGSIYISGINKKEFTDKDGKKVSYTEVLVLDEKGYQFNVTCDDEVVELLKVKQNNNVTFSLTTKQYKPKLKIIGLA